MCVFAAARSVRRGTLDLIFDIFDVMYVTEYVYLFSPLLGASH